MTGMKGKVRATKKTVCHGRGSRRTSDHWGGLTYSDKDLDAIAEAISVPAAKVQDERAALESAAGWFRSDQRTPMRTPPSKTRAKLKVLGNALEKTLKMLEDPDVRDAVGYAAEHRNANLEPALRSIADLADWTEGAEPTTTFTDDAGNKRNLVHPGHAGNTALDTFLACILPIYERLTGRSIGTSIGSPGGQHEGEAGGPLIRFVQACLAPLSVDPQTSDALRQRIRRIKEEMSAPADKSK